MVCSLDITGERDPKGLPDEGHTERVDIQKETSMAVTSMDVKSTTLMLRIDRWRDKFWDGCPFMFKESFRKYREVSTMVDRGGWRGQGRVPEEKRCVRDVQSDSPGEPYWVCRPYKSLRYTNTGDGSEMCDVEGLSRLFLFCFWPEVPGQVIIKETLRKGLGRTVFFTKCGDISLL